MERLINTLRGRLLGVVLVINAALAPLLYLGVSEIVQEGYADLFVNSVRSYSRLVADQLETASAPDFDAHAAYVLDDVVLSGQVVYAELTDGERKLHSSIGTATEPLPSGDDFHFGEHGDQTYYVSHTVKRGAHSVVLRLGFDESPTLERILAAKRHVLTAILAFALVSIVVAVWLSAVIARPMVRLQEAARRIAGGDVRTHLEMHSSIREVRDLNHQLERMRQELVGTNERLQNEIRERVVSEEKRFELERRLQHRERIATIGTLAGGVAHEFNNIMTPILLYSQVALDEVPEGSALAGDLTRIVAAAHRARSLVTRILTFSREMDSQGSSVFLLRPTVEEALALVRAIMPANIEIVVDAAGGYRADTGGPEPGTPDRHQPVHQRLPGDAGLGRQACRAPRRHGKSGQDRAGGALRAAGSQRHRSRHGAGGHGTHLRALLHHARGWRGHRAGPVGGARHRDLHGRQHQRGIRTGQRHEVQRLPAGSSRASTLGRRGRQRRGVEDATPWHPYW